MSSDPRRPPTPAGERGCGTSVAADGDRARSVSALLDRNARLFGDHVALTHAGATYSWRDLHGLVQKTVADLRARGVAPGERLAVPLAASIESVALLWAAAALGATIVALDPSAPREIWEARATAAQATWLVVPQAGTDPRLARLGGIAPSAKAAPAPLTVVFTSGSGGRPKAVPLWSKQYLASAEATVAALALVATDRWLAVMPMFHVGGLAILFRALVSGGGVELHERFVPRLVADRLRGGEISFCSLVPTMLARLLPLLEPSGADQMSRLLLGGAPVPSQLLRVAEQLGIGVYRAYGMTETASMIALARPGEEGAEPLPGVELRIEGTKQSGEILVRGPMVSPAATDREGWLHTGDVGFLDRAGRLHVRGRLKNIVITGGENVSPEEVERVLEEHEQIAEVGVAGVPDPEWGELLVALVVRRARSRALGSDAELTESVRSFCRWRLERYKVPKRVFTVAALPRTATGKIDRSALTALARSLAQAAG